MFDFEKKKREVDAQSLAIEALLDMIAETSPRKAAEVKLIKSAKKHGDIAKDFALRSADNEDITIEQFESASEYIRMATEGLKTFIEQFESTVEKNPHNSGN